MSQQADKNRRDRTFTIGDFVFLKLQPYRQHSLRRNTFHKLLPKFYGPFKVIDRIGQAAYQLELPSSVEIHNVFHVSQLKLCKNPATCSIQSLPLAAGFLDSPQEPEAILDRKMVKRGRVAATKVLIKWKNFPAEQSTWEFYYDVLKKFPNFHP
uniref:Chromo domain-containing protein n=1 Tax=Cajanus cajan TaxID=3821 RepID=A0A151SYI0_CAJCA|nr:hypothetical protein KK1_015222 [Cajanus cajan]